jgi:selenide,water dikinase
LDQALAGLPRVPNPQVLLGFETSDDAGVYKLNTECALVQTVDFFTPIVDDPFTYGAIAAANSLSDIYAMGAKPLSSLAILAYPASGDMEDLREILRGGWSKMLEADCPVIGGHSVADPEIKFGYSVTGQVHPDRVLYNRGAQPGDVLLFTKRIGTGVIATAQKRGIARETDVEEAVQSMLTLNRLASEALERFKVHACTDVSGFGLLGHAREMAAASEVTLEIDAGSVRMLPGALEYAEAGALPGGLRNNREFVGACVEIDRPLPAEAEALLYDPQTSGGLLIAVAPEDAAGLHRSYDSAYRIGQVSARGSSMLRVL